MGNIRTDLFEGNMDRNDSKRLQLAKLLQPEAGNLGIAGAMVLRAMTPHPTCILPDMNALELIKLFHEKRFRHLLVTQESGELVGIISDRDVVGCLGPNGAVSKEALQEIKALDLMSVDLIWVTPESSLTKAISLMVENGISCLPVIHEQRPVGIITSTDLYLLLEQLLKVISADSSAEPVSSASSRS